MRRLRATVTCDITLQFRNGFYYASAFVVAVWSLLLSQLRLPDLGWVIPAVVSGNLMLTTFYFIGGLVLLEKGEATLEAQIVTPLRAGEYLLAKVITLTLLSLVENVIVVALFDGFSFRPLPLVAGIILASALYILAGFVAVVRYASINEYLLPSVLYTAALSLPLMPYLAHWDSWVVYLHPLHAPLVIIKASFEPISPPLLMYGLLYSASWIGLGYVWSRRDFRRFVVGGTSSL